jgi:uncharacterized membrane protein
VIAKRSGWNDQKIEQVVGNLLRAGVTMAALIVVTGGILYLVRYGNTRPDYSFFHGEPWDFRSLRGIVHDALLLRPRGVIQFGILCLIATPVARVAFSAVAFMLEKDRLYVVVTLIVLSVLLYSLFLARA